jgi:hypothetical protein
MAKQTEIQKAIANIDMKITNLQAARQELLDVQASRTAKSRKKPLASGTPRLVEPATEVPRG